MVEGGLHNHDEFNIKNRSTVSVIRKKLEGIKWDLLLKYCKLLIKARPFKL